METQARASPGAGRRRLHDDLLPRTGRRAGDSGISDNAGPILAGLLFGHGQRTAAANVFCRAAAGWDGY